MPSAISLDQLPVEILFGICRHLDIPDVLRVRRVSRYLNEISHCRDIWANAYRRTDSIAPPGPFPSQSASDLENMLVPSFRVTQNLRHNSGTKQSEEPGRKLGEIQYTGIALRVNLVFGRLLLIALSEEVRCYDLNQVSASNRELGASILYRPMSGTSLTSFYCASAVGVDGRPFACVVMKEVEGRAAKQTQISIYLLNVTGQVQVTLDLIHQFKCSMFNIHSVDLGPRMIVVQGSMNPPPISDRHVVVFDVHARVRLPLPLTNETWRTDEAQEDTTFFISSICTSTHIILARSFYAADRWNTIFNSYPLPLANTHEPSTPLRLSHRGIIPDTLSDHLVLLHDAIFDSSTQDILVMIRLCTFDSCCDIPRSKHGVLHLGRSHPDEVGVITFQELGPFGRFPRDLFDRPSFNGIGRVFYVVPPWTHGTVAAFEYDVRSHGSGKDESGCNIREYPSILQFPTPRRLLDYDPYRGRICLQSVMDQHNVVEIWDL